MDTKQTCYLFFDLDGTVLIDRQISKPTLDAMHAAQRLGHKLILCTGRSFGMLESVNPFMTELHWDGMLLGATDIRWEGKVLLEDSIPHGDAMAWLEYCMEHRYYFSYEGVKRARHFPFNRHEGILSEKERADCRRLVEEEAADQNPATKLAVWEPRDEIDRKRMPKVACNIIYQRDYIEIFLPGCDKGTLIQKFRNLLGISREQCACFGDSYNDVEMFRACAYSVAMKPSPDELIALASHHAQSEDGVAEGLLRIFGDELTK